MYYYKNLTADECFGLVKTQVSKHTFESNNSFKAEELHISELDLNDETNKKIVILCGNKTTSPMNAGHYANYCFNWLNEFNDRSNVTAYSIYYPHEQPLMSYMTPNPRFDYSGLAKIMFGQIISKNEKIQSAEDIANQLGDITFFGHSIGGFVMNELMFHLGSMLKNQNFSDEDINKVYSSVVFVGYAPFALVDAPINSVYVAPVYDSVGSTKLVYDKKIKNREIVSSNPNLDISNICKFKANSYFNFLKLYETAIGNDPTLYFVDGNSLVSTPNLLFSDGFKEDHNLAGVIDYPSEHPQKTEAGKLTTQFLHNVFNYCLSQERTKFSVSDLFKQAVSQQQSSENPSPPNKEL